MESANLPDNEKDRLKALQEFDILDSEQDGSFDDIVDLASQICETPISLVSLVDQDRQWFKAKKGLEADSTSRDIAFCAHAILDKDNVFVVKNAEEDVRFRDNPLVQSDPKIRFYAGAPLTDTNGNSLGTLCVIDDKPRDLNPFQKEALACLSRQVMRLIESRKRVKEVGEMTAKLLEKEKQLLHANDELSAINELNVKFLKANTLLEILQLLAKSISNYCHASLAMYLLVDESYKLWWNNLEGEDYPLTPEFDPNEFNFEKSRHGYRLITPIISEGEVVGFFKCFKWDRKSFTAIEEEYFDLLTSNSSTKIKNAIYREEMDVTEKHLARVQNNSDQILELALDAVVSIGPDGYVTGWNKQALEIFGYSREEAIGKKLTELIIPNQHREGHTKGMEKFHKTGEGPVLGNRIEISAIDRNNREFPVELTVIPLKTEKEITFTAFIRDISVRLKAEEELKEALLRQKKLSEMKSRFVSMTSHEFRTPLTSISSNVELLQYYLKDEPEEKGKKIGRNFDRIVQEIDRLTSLMNDILLMGRIDSGKIPFKPSLKSIDELCRNIISERFSRLNDGRTTEYIIEGEPFNFWIDENLYTHILSNILSNAFKYSLGKANPEVTLSFNEDSFTLEVKDFGMGIPLEEQEGIFETFTRGSNVENIQGTGMGLPIVQQFIKLHKGDIHFESEPEVETKFIITQPYIEYYEKDSGH